ncbi:MAG: hypothetical protein JSR78_11790 [Proteobacteria bacterium]|nr:hypothetical protein [Pseudomonadota bacterium]
MLLLAECRVALFFLMTALLLEARRLSRGVALLPLPWFAPALFFMLLVFVRLSRPWLLIVRFDERGHRRNCCQKRSGGQSDMSAGSHGHFLKLSRV